MLLLIILLLCSLSARATAELQLEGTASPPSFRILQPAWAINQSADLALNFTAADAAAKQQETAPITFRGKPLESVSLRAGYFYGNIAVVRFGTQFITAVRKIQFYITPRNSVADYPLDADPKKNWISWWTNRISLCAADPLTLQPQACTNYDPRNWTDCMWNGGFETLGPEDPRLIIWPSKGLFVLFNSKPWAVNPTGTKPADTQCDGPWAQQPWLAPLVTHQGVVHLKAPSSNTPATHQQQQQAPSRNTPDQQAAEQQQQQADPWTQGLIRLQYLPPELQEGNATEVLQRLQKQHGASGPYLHKQKNWNAFIYNDELYFSQSFLPHVVIKPAADGTCSIMHVTDGAAFAHLPARVRGNTQAVLVPAAVSGLQQAVYLGIVHTEVDRRYTNYMYQMEAEPPFAITAVSAALPLVPGQHPRVPAWNHISFPMSLQLLDDTNQLMIGYGSGDQVPRVRFLPLPDALVLFDNSAGSNSQQQGEAAVEAGPGASAATDVGLSSKLAGKLGRLSPRAQAAAHVAVAAMESAMGLKPAAAAGNDAAG